MATSIFLTINIYIRLTRLLKVDLFNAKYDLEKRLYQGCTGANKSDDNKIVKVISTNNNEDDDEEDP